MKLNGNRLRRIREREKMTLLQFWKAADDAGLRCSPASISQWETGMHHPKNPEYVAGILAGILGVDESDLLREDGV